ncbi:hypothetical protein SEPCBS57363_003445 [Sporothrix epigloea]|uniref:Uncharacterized protein n=1 Tax=Sporothrix epigloea TaxID=1892477 RepID=A0ABP0DLG5_9PEZI
MDELALRQLNGDEDEDEALRRALAMSMDDSIRSPGGTFAASDGQTDTQHDIDNDAQVENQGDDVSVTQAHGLTRSASTATTASTASSASELPLSAPPMTAINDGPVPEGDPAAPFPEAAATAVDTSAPTSTLSLLALDRKAMEAERLARRQKAFEAQIARTGTSATLSTASSEHNVQQKEQPEAQPEAHHPEQSGELPRASKKRKAEDDVIVIDNDDDHVDEMQKVTKRDGNSHPPPSRRRLDEDTLTRERGKQVNPPAQFAQTLKLPTHIVGASSLPGLLPYARGVVKKTWVRGQPRLGDDVTIDEIWQKSHLELAVLSSFQWDEEWLAAHLDFQRTRVMLIAYAADDGQVCHPSLGLRCFFLLSVSSCQSPGCGWGAFF